MSAGLERLLLQLEVDQLNAAYAAALDEKRFDDWPAFFLPDGKYTVAPVESPKGTTLWKIDLVAAEAAHKSRRR